ncbi:hypothetical protein KFV02_11220 [Desulfohalobiaceae bacterium Ax17]|uniref:hypothetical protein n=1 Tax=Desulfovulcanus ferrireducens TaxID=2831190 RepID=UPI00207BA332|nr:hypothetical protein [Desulfovulcanus ferrireducens]MBT8764503.1 hypothetical protein [Desulfovulcanus ferrireducens]
MNNMSFLQRYYGPIALVFLVICELLLFLGEPLVGQWFYLLAWWPYIFFVDWVVKRRTGNSLLMDRAREFLWLIPWSTFFWLIFEWFNLFLKNWHYVNIISSIQLRWAGYFLSFGTVLPGLFETYELLASYKIFSDRNVKPVRDAKKLYPWFLILGALFLVLPLAYPRYFFPLIWGTFVFLLEPINHALGAPSLLREWEKGSLRKFFLLLFSGLICGVLWEFWNFWAQSKWIYTVPFVGDIKLFEMPVAGFLGFPPFAVECYCLVSFISIFRKGRTWERDRACIGAKTSLTLKVFAFILHLLFYAFMFHAIDVYTVKSYL